MANVNSIKSVNGYPIASTNPPNGNIVIGNSFTSNTTGSNNTAYGVNALSANIDGSNNTAIGFEALKLNTSGTNNTALGYQAGSNITTGSNLTCIGSGSAASASTAVNEITLGNGAITTLRCQVQTITAISDARDKNNINPLPIGIDFINDLNPVEFDWNKRDGSKVDIHDIGFIAQELKASQEKLGVTVPKLLYESNPDRLEASYGTLLPIMVKAIKELKLELEQLKQNAA
jgi:hypothetical protein